MNLEQLIEAVMKKENCTAVKVFKEEDGKLWGVEPIIEKRKGLGIRNDREEITWDNVKDNLHLTKEDKKEIKQEEDKIEEAISSRSNRKQ